MDHLLVVHALKRTTKISFTKKKKKVKSGGPLIESGPCQREAVTSWCIEKADAELHVSLQIEDTTTYMLEENCD